ncbi:hypothetical protein [Amycolatopsis sp. H20-H5]|uniref:hypothetical protein n=1 Tax=Amycolatopsis sp. H20-H5 TaxID=3046309 RepID=UPI002DB86BCE|nr:hypothetical protein [Amycolatopsis sp. H20-H5]MEC3976730.1 hypothetical protein [Amycolatopsis sp. H20-H5]
MLDVVFGVPRRVAGRTLHVLRTAFEALESIPRIASAVDELRASLRQCERLATFAAGELPELVYQLEQIRERLDELDRRPREIVPEEVSPVSRRNG